MLRSILYFFVVLPILAALSTPICAGAATRSIHVEWGYTPPSVPEVAGFKLYQEGAFACQTLKPATTSMDCTVPLTKATTRFTLTALFNDGTESPHSTPFAFSAAAQSGTATAQNAPAATPAAAVISSSVAAGTSPLLVAFDGSASTAANKGTIVAYGWNYGDGDAAAGVRTTHTFAAAGTYVATLTITDSKGNQSRATTPIVVVAKTATVSKAATTVNPSASSSISSGVATTSKNVQTAAVQIAAPKTTPNLEAGEVSVGGDWVRVVFANRYANPIVIAGPPRFNNSTPCVVRIRNVTAAGFEVRLAEWPYQDGKHSAETIGYLAMEKGRTQLADGSRIEAGSFTGTTRTNPVAFGAAMNKIPVVLTSIVSVNDADTAVGRVSAVGRSGFSYAFSEQEKSSSGSHANETVHYVAWEPGKGMIGEVQFEAAAGPSITSSWSTVRFQSAFKQQPMVLADLQSNANSDTAALRLRQQATTTGFLVKVEEEQSLDLETAHPVEQVGYLALTQP
jgi:PKD repeat protein